MAKRARAVCAGLVLAMLVPGVAQAQNATYLLGWKPTDFNPFSTPDWSLTYVEVKPGANPAARIAVRMNVHYATVKSRALLADPSDRDESTLSIDCKTRMISAETLTRHAAGKAGPVTKLAASPEAIRPGSIFAVAAEIGCDGQAAKHAAARIADRPADAARRLADLQAVFTSGKGGRWFVVGESGTAPNRTAVLVDMDSIASAGTRRAISGQYVYETPEPANPIKRRLYRWSLDCTARTGTAQFSASYKTIGPAEGARFLNDPLSVSVGQALADVACGKPLPPERARAGTAISVAQGYFPKP